jgi:hypothetical protein
VSRSPPSNTIGLSTARMTVASGKKLSSAHMTAVLPAPPGRAPTSRDAPVRIMAAR